MTLVDKLITSAEKTKSILCFGLDPVLEKMPPYFKHPRDITTFFNTIFHEMYHQNVQVGAFKPNEGYYLKHDQTINGTTIYDGSEILTAIIKSIKQFKDTPIILDIKRGDTTTSSTNYAEHSKKKYSPDAVTVNPYMGTDSITPFLPHGAYILCRTSNLGAKDLQDLHFTDGDRIIPLYMKVAQLIAGWHDISPGNVGAVIGANNPAELELIAKYFKNTGKKIPLLIPGIGQQQGKTKEVTEKLKTIEYDLRIVRVNVSSGISESWNTDKPEDYTKTIIKKIMQLNEEIGDITSNHNTT